ncbi:MAG: hypothetical protein FE834_06745 [Gammaproteobacteria bacterium]|nr:hypothetical protein [Gammaproteobacteria bacterium]
MSSISFLNIDQQDIKIARAFSQENIGATKEVVDFAYAELRLASKDGRFFKNGNNDKQQQRNSRIMEQGFR